MVHKVQVEEVAQLELVWVEEVCNKVLVVEDNKVNQRVVRGLLERAGCEVVVAENGMWWT